MPRKIKDLTRASLEAVPLPVHAATYTVISHKSIMDYALAEITAMGFTIEKEEYRATHDGQIAQGIYQLNYNSDTEMSLMFAWTNSYNKQIRFKCAVGGYVHANQTVMLCGEIGTYARKHTGTADADTIAMMKNHLTNAKMYYDNLVLDKEQMKLIPMSLRRQSEILGVLFAEYEILTTEQASIMRQQMDKPSYFYNGGKDTLWAFYNHATVALQQSHPRTWMEDQRMLHWFITNEVGLATPAIPLNVMMDDVVTDPLYEIPNQTNILDQIAEVTEEESLLAAQYPVTEEEAFQAPDNQVVKNGSDFDIDLHQSDEIILSTTEEQNVLIKNEDGLFEEILIYPAEQEIKECIDDIVVQYTDPAGNTFEAPVVEEKLSLDDILIRIPNEEKASLSPFEKMQQRLEEANARIEAEAEEVEKEWEEETNITSSLTLTPEETVEYQDELDEYQASEEELNTLQEKLEAREVRTIATEILKEESTFDFDLSEDTEKPIEESNDFDFF